MKKGLWLILAMFIISGTVMAQGSAVSYYRKINNEKKKFDKKRMNYLRVSIENENPRKVEKYHSMVVEQLASSIVEFKKMKPYQGDSAYVNDYIRIFKMYQKAYTDGFEKVKALEDSAKVSYNAMMAYLNAIESMEFNLLDASDKLERNDAYFSSKYNFDLIEDSEMLAELDLLNAVILYSRDVYRAYYRVEFQITKYKELKVDLDLDIKEQRHNRMDFIKAIEMAKSDIVKLGDFEEEDGRHAQEVIKILDDLKDAVDGDLAEILDLLDDGSYDERKWDKGISKYEKFIESLDAYNQEYFESKADFVNSYLPEK